MTWTPRDEAERAAVVALCVEAVRKRSDSNFDHYSDGAVAERIVPPVPTPESEYRTYKGVTYKADGANGNGTKWFWFLGNRYVSAAEVIASWHTTFTDDDHAALLDLKANPVQVTPTPATVASEPVASEPAWYKGVTYNGREWVDSDCGAFIRYTSLSKLLAANSHIFTDDDIAPLLALRLPTTGAAHE